MEDHIKIPADDKQPNPLTHLLGGVEEAAGAGDDDGGGGFDREIRCLETLFRVLGFYQHPLPWFAFSWALFLLLGISVPLLVFLLSNCSSSGRDGWSPIVEFDVCVMAAQASLAVVSLLCVSHNLRKYGMRKLLFVGKSYEGLERLHGQYAARIKGFFRALVFWVLPGVIAKTSREAVRIFYVYHESGWQFLAMLLASVLSWTYLTDTEVSALLEEHTSLCHYLSKISHRFRIHLLLVFLISVASQFVTLLLATQYAKIVDFINAGDFAVCAVVQVIGIVLCLNAATRISHRAQSIASLASRWHVLLTCRYSSHPEKTADVNCKLEVSDVNQATKDHPREVVISSDIAIQGKEQFTSFASLQYQRQALVMYLQSNSRGITIYGWDVDRGLINAIFAIELSLLLFVFGRTL